MSTLLVFRSPRSGDAEKLAAALGPETLASMRVVRQAPVKLVAHSLEASTEAWVAVDDGEPICAWGYRAEGLVAVSAFAWCIATPAVQRHKRLMWAENLKFVARLREQFPHIEAFCHADYAVSQRWLRRLGFTLYEPRNGFPFFPAVLER
jgi:hypothetical protein